MGAAQRNTAGSPFIAGAGEVGGARSFGVAKVAFLSAVGAEAAVFCAGVSRRTLRGLVARHVAILFREAVLQTRCERGAAKARKTRTLRRTGL